MIVHNGVENLGIVNPIVTIGSFDGVHRGHQFVIEAVRGIAAAHNGQSVVLTFDTHPRRLLFPEERPLGILTSFAEKMELLEKAGVDHVVVLPFTRELASMDYRSFVADVLIGKIGMKGIVVGYDHRFGKGRIGSFDTLLQLSDEFGFYVEREKPYNERAINVSSTKIRIALDNCNLKLAKDYLGYDYGCRGIVMKGHSFGRTIGFPTANIAIDDPNKLLPGSGVYAITAECCGVHYGGMLDIGVRPTIREDGVRSIEAHLFGLDSEIYGEELRISFIERMRNEVRFPDAEALREQLTIDKKRAQEILAKL